MTASRLEQTMQGPGLIALAAALFRDDVTYTPRGGSARTIAAQLVVRRDETAIVEPGETREQIARLVTRNDETTGIEAVDRGASVVCDGVTWIVRAGEVGLDGLTRLDLVRFTDVSRAPGGYRATQ